jgi:hypothetical protein
MKIFSPFISVFFLICFFFSSSVFANNEITRAPEKWITIFGINLGMDIVDIFSELDSRGFGCGPMTHEDPSKDFYECNKEDSIIKITKDSIRFNCNSFNGCNKNVDKISAKLVRDNIIAKTKVKRDEGESDIFGNEDYWKVICGSKKYDEICVTQHDRYEGHPMVNQTKKSYIDLEISLIKSDEISFD